MTSRSGAPPLLYIVAATVAVVVLLLAIFNGARGDVPDVASEIVAIEDVDSPPTTTPAGEQEAVPGPSAAPVAPTAVEASSALSDAFAPEMLIDGNVETAWNDASLHGDGAVLTFRFDRQVAFETMTIVNITDAVHFAQNFRARGYVVEIAGAPAPITGELDDTQQPQTIGLVGAVGDTVTFRVVSTYEAEAVEGGPPLEELAISEVSFTGR